MSAILRTGERFGTEHLVRLLTGDATEAIRRHGHDTLPTFGVGRERNANAWRSIFRQIYAAGLISLDIVEHGRWTVTTRGRLVLRGSERVELRHDVLQPATGKRGAGGKRGAARADRGEVEAALDAAGTDLLAALKALRRSLAQARDQPAYVVFADRTLIEMAAQRPVTPDALRRVHGVGETKLQTYGEAFLAVIREHGPP